MSNIDTTDVILAGLGVGGFFWMNRKLDNERRARTAAEHERDCARACALRVARISNGIAPSKPAPRPSGLAPRMFDSIFAAYGHGIPVPYLRALALRESNMNARSSSGPAWGLLQVIEVVRTDYNQRTGARYTRQDLLDPAINVTIASSALSMIIQSYAQKHPRITNLQPNWNNPRFIELLTFGWNAGWSERGGVGRVSTFLEQRGIVDQTIDTIHQAAHAAGASDHLASTAKVAWCKSVAAQYFRELAAERPTIEMPEEYVGRPVIEMPEEYVGRPAIVVTGPITQPSQVATSIPVTSPSQVSAPTMTPIATTSPPSPFPHGHNTGITGGIEAVKEMVTAQTPSGLGGPIDPYQDCTCKA